MRLFGKILLVINLLLSGGLVYLTLQDWQGRQMIAAAGNRHVMLRDGLPLEDKGDAIPPRVQPDADGYSDFSSTKITFEVEGPGGVKTTTVSPELLYAYFAGAGQAGANSLGGTMPVASQMGEVKRVYAILKAQPDASKVSVYGAILLRLAESFVERSDYREWFEKGNLRSKA